MTARPATVLLGLVLFAAACTAGTPTMDPPAAEPPTTEVDGPAATPSPAKVPAPITVDWSSDAGDAVDLGDGWTAGGCEGDAPLLCVARDGEAVGLVELVTFPVDPAIAEAEDPLAAQVQAIHAAHRPDRETGCPDGYAVLTPAPSPATVAGDDGLRYELAVDDDRGHRVEHVVGFVTVQGDRVLLVVANALGEGSCVVDDEFVGFTPDELAAFGDRLDRVVAGSRLPGE